jgi:hypothetical protein
MSRLDDLFDDLFDDPKLARYLERAEKEMLPAMKSSALTIIITAEPDIKLCCEVGAAVMFDKPFVLLVTPGRRVPNNLRRLASVIVEGEASDPATAKRMQRALENVLKNDARCKERTQ